MAERIRSASEPAVRNVPLPQHADSYTVIPNALAIDESRKQLGLYGFKILKEDYRLGGLNAEGHGQIAMGRYICEIPNAPLGFSMLLLWVNSYDKSTRFKVSIGVHLADADTDIIKGDSSSFRRKHTGKADEEVVSSLDEKLKIHAQLFQDIMDDKALMEKVDMDVDKQSFFLGKAFLDWKILTTEKIQSAKKALNKPTYQPDCNNAWCFYIRTLSGCASEHPRSYVETFRSLHGKLMYYVVAGFPDLSKVDVDVPMDPAYTNVPAALAQQQLQLNAEDADKDTKTPIPITPNQLSLLEPVKHEVKQEILYDLDDDGPVETVVETLVPVEPIRELPQDVVVEPETKVVNSETFSIASELFKHGYDPAFKGEIMEAYAEAHGFGEVEETLFREFLAHASDLQQYKKAETSEEKAKRLLASVAQRRTLVEDIAEGKVEEIVVEAKPEIFIPQVEWEFVDTTNGLLANSLYDYRVIDGKMHRKLKRTAVVVDASLDDPDFFMAPSQVEVDPPVEVAPIVVNLEVPSGSGISEFL